VVLAWQQEEEQNSSLLVALLKLPQALHIALIIDFLSEAEEDFASI